MPPDFLDIARPFQRAQNGVIEGIIRIIYNYGKYSGIEPCHSFNGNAVTNYTMTAPIVVAIVVVVHDGEMHSHSIYMICYCIIFCC